MWMNITAKTCGILTLAFVLGCSVVATQHHSADGNHDADIILTDHTTEQDSADLHHSTSLQSNAGSYLAGRSASLHNDHIYATHYLGHALKENPKNPLLLQLSLKHAMLSGDMDTAMSLAEDAHSANAPNRLTHLLRFTKTLKSGDIKTAKEHSNALQPIGIHALILPFITSWMDYATLSTAQRVIVADGLKHGAYKSLQHYHHGLQYQLQGNLADAENAFDKAVTDIDVAPDAVIFGVVRFLIAGGNQGKAETILSNYQKQHNRDPLWRTRTPKEMLKELAEDNKSNITNVAGGIAEIFANMATLIGREGAMQEAQNFIMIARYLEPDNAFIRYHHAQILESSGQYENALSHYDAIATPPFLAELSILQTARIHHALEETDKAQELLLSEANDHGIQFNRYMMLGDIARIDKKFSDAASYYSKAVAMLEPPEKKDWNLIYRRGIMYDQAKQWEKAEADFQQALALYEDQPQVLNYLAYSWLVRGEHLEKAETMLLKAVTLRPNDAHIIDSYGWALYKLGRYKEALPRLEEALSLLPSDPTINDHYGDVLWRLGRTNEAVYQWERALLFEPPEEKDKDAITQKLTNGLPDDSQPIQQSNAN